MPSRRLSKRRTAPSSSRKDGSCAALAAKWWTTCSVSASTFSTRPSYAFTRPTCRCRTPRTWSGPPSPTRRKRSPPCERSCISTETRSDDGNQGVHGSTLADDGGRTPRQMVEERGRFREERRSTRRGRDRQGHHGARGAGRRRAAQAPGQRG